MSSQLPPAPVMDSDERGMRGLPPFVDVVYGAVFGYGIIEAAQAVLHWKPKQPGNGTPVFLLIVTSVYLLFDYAQGRMFTEKHPYKGLTRFTLDLMIAGAFTVAYVTAASASTKYLLALAAILFLGAWWVSECRKEYPTELPRRHFIVVCHIAPLVAVLAIWALRFLPYPWITDRWHAHVNLTVCLLYLAYCIVLTIITAGTRVTGLERSLLPIIPFYAPWRRVQIRARRVFKL
jgi:hypothetical protein